MSSLRRKRTVGVIERRNSTQAPSGQKVKGWVYSRAGSFSVYTLSANRIAQMSVVYGETTHLLITESKGIKTETNRINIGGEIYEPTYVNEDHPRKVQVFARKISIPTEGEGIG